MLISEEVVSTSFSFGAMLAISSKQENYNIRRNVSRLSVWNRTMFFLNYLCFSLNLLVSMNKGQMDVIQPDVKLSTFRTTQDAILT
jgi:alpha/beta superfamily hydrolase